MALKLRIFYRGPLVSCNYDCHYCPFAKHHETAAELQRDRESLERFVGWVGEQADCELSILFTPWGEALPRRWYQQSIGRLSHMPHVVKVAIQTNLSGRLDWLDEVDRNTVALWCTFHPSQTSQAAFLDQCHELNRRAVRYSVGMVGLHESFSEIESLRVALLPHVYLWVNAYKDVLNYYSPEQIAQLERIDPLFRVNNVRHRSLNEPCAAGETSVSIDGDGNLRRCHFVDGLIGNIYRDGWRQALQPRTCPNATCGCYIGYVQLPKLQHERLFGSGLLERIPDASVWNQET